MQDDPKDPAPLDPSGPVGRRGVRVLKFGGTSLADAGRVNRAAAIVARARAEGAAPVVVVSAMGGATDELLGLTADATAGDPGWKERLGALARRHDDALCRVRSGGEDAGEPEDGGPLEARVASLEEALRGVHLLRECPPGTRDRILSAGEDLSAIVLDAALRARGVPSRIRDPRRFVITDARHGSARVDEAATGPRVREALDPAAEVPVIPGFVGASPDGRTTTLGRGGSDHTATLLGACLGAERVEIWTDVDGIMTADPRAVPGARRLEAVSYDELAELSSFGAAVVHPPAVHPARDAGVPLVVRSTVEPDRPGTRVEASPPDGRAGPVRGISAISGVALLRLEEVERVGPMEVCERLFRTLLRHEVKVLLFTRDSSGHSLSLAVSEEQRGDAGAAIRTEFQWERRRGMLDDPRLEGRRAILAAVGDGMRDTPGVSGRFFGVLGARGVNVDAIAQGASERNISCVVAEADRVKALRALHAEFFGGARAGGGGGEGGRERAEGGRVGGHVSSATTGESR